MIIKKQIQMKIKDIKVILFVLALLLPTLSVSAQKHLTILHTNDTHSCVMPLSVHLADTLQAGRGGFLRRIAMLKEERRKDPGLLLFDRSSVPTIVSMSMDSTRS